MTVRYKAVQMNSPLKKGENKQQYYPRVANRQKKNLRDVAELISQTSSFSTIDVVGILEAFATKVPELLLDNCTVELGDLGNFSLHVSGEGVDTAQEVNASKIKSVKVAFRPSVRVKKQLKQIDFKRI